MIKTGAKLIVFTMLICIVLSICDSESFSVYASSKSKPTKVQSLKITKVTTTSATLKWKKVKRCDGYEILRNNKIIKRQKAQKYIDYKLTGGKKYSYTVRAYVNYKQRQFYNTKKRKWVTRKPPRNEWQEGRIRYVLKRRYGPYSAAKKITTKPNTEVIEDLITNNVPKPSPYAAKIPVLAFHRVVSDDCKKDYYPDNEWVASVSDFKKEMKYLYDNQYEVISLQDFERWYDGEIELPKKTVVLTFDDGDYEIYYLVYPILKEYGFRATSFIIGSKTEEITAEYVDDGSKHFIGKDLISLVREEYPELQFQSHSYDLHYKTSDGKCAAGSKDYDELDLDFMQNSSFKFTYIAYPYGYYNNDLTEAAKANGIKMGFAMKYACATRNADRYSIPRVTINGQISYNQYVALLQAFIDD